LTPLLEYLYTRFLLRDFLAKALPGFIVIGVFYLSFIHDKKTFSDVLEVVKTSNITLISFMLSSYLLMFAVGMLIQFIGMQLRIVQIHPWIDPEPPRTKRTSMKERTKLSLQKAWSFLQQNKEIPFALTQRERSAVLKEMTGNLAMAIFIVVLISFVKHFDVIKYLMYLPTSQQLPLPLSTDVWFIVTIWIVLIATGCFLSRQNRYHCYEQLCWEKIGTKILLGPFSSRM